MKQILKRLANFILADRKIVYVEISQINYGNILAERNIVITGGAGGIGLSMARKFVSEGAKVLIVGRNESKLKMAAESLGSHAQYRAFDVSEVNKIHDFIADITTELGVIDGLVCCAGVSLHEGGIENVTEQGYQQQMDINLKANYFLCKAFIESKKKHNASTADILLISSLTSNQPYDLPYGMAKAALNSLVQKLNSRFYSQGIRVNAIAPGIIPTDITKCYVDVSDGNMFLDSSCGRYFLPEEIAEVATFLLSKASRIIGGEVITCDGGMTQKSIWK